MGPAISIGLKKCTFWKSAFLGPKYWQLQKSRQKSCTCFFTFFNTESENGLKKQSEVLKAKKIHQNVTSTF